MEKMEKNQKTKLMLPVEFERMNDRKDRSCTLTFATRELTNDEVGFLRNQRGTEGWLLYAPNTMQAEDVPQEDAERGKKTPSQRLRAVLFVYWKQLSATDETTLEFEAFYKAEMEKIIEVIKTRKLRDQKV